MHIDKFLDVAKLEKLAEHIKTRQGDLVRDVAIDRRELTVKTRPTHLIELMTFLRDDKNCQFKMLVTLCGADYPQAEERFEVVYHMLSVTKNVRIRVKLSVDEGQQVPTLTGLFPNADWYERETYDMYGIMFEEHPDLRRILTDYEFTDFPLRKDFPVEGKTEMFYDEEQKRCVYRPTNLPKDFRHFEWKSPWLGMDNPYHLAEEDNAFDADEFAKARVSE